MTAVTRCATLLGFLVLSIACNNADRATGTLPTQPSSTAPSFPPLSGPAAIYLFSGPLLYPVRDYTMTSRYVLYDNGAFSLQYLGGEYVGAYRLENGVTTFRFATDSRWDATGTSSGDSLEVRYNLNMELSDFENAVYRRSQ